jgi:hypothetical protein
MIDLPDDWKQQWRDATRNLTYRAEALEDASASFAETAFLEMIMVKRNQVIFGRRGTGKTHLLRRAYDGYNTEYDRYRTVPIFLNGSSLRQSASSTMADPEIEALSLYVEILGRMTEQLHQFITKRLDLGVWDRLVGGEQSAKARRAKQLVTELATMIQAGEVRVMPAGEVSEETKSLQEASAEVAAGLGIELSDPKKLGWELTAKIKGSEKTSKTGLRTLTLKGRVILPFSEVSRALDELLGILQGSSLVLLLDEWSDVSRHLESQPYLADMLKRTLASADGMHVKLACIPMRTMLATQISEEHPIPIGYEIGNDIFADVDLDRAAYVENDVAMILPFYLTLLKKHIGRRFLAASEMGPGDFEKFVFAEVFNDVEVFSELCQAAACVPREFLQLYQNASSLAELAGQTKLGMGDVRRASKSIYEDKKDKVRVDSPAIALHNGIYKSVVVPHSTYLFLVPESLVFDTRMQILWTERLIHKLPYTYEDPETLTTYVYFQMDHGRCVTIREQQAATAGAKKGKAWAAGVRSVVPGDSIWGAIVQAVADWGLPLLTAAAEKRRVLLNTPAGNLTPDPSQIKADRAFEGQPDGKPNKGTERDS